MIDPRTNKESRSIASRDKTTSDIRRQVLAGPSTGNRGSRRIALALVTLSWSSLNAPFRSILNGFYYLAAIVSLLLLIAYFHQAKAQQAHHKTVEQVEFLQLAGGSSLGTARSRLRRGPKIGGTGTKSQAKRAPQAAAVMGARATGMAATRAPPKAASSQRPSQMPELTFRLAGDQSENNRGTRQFSPATNQPNETQPLLPSGSQWKPIVDKPPRRPVQQLPFAPPPPPPDIYLPAAPLLPPPVALSPVGHEPRHQPPAHWNGGHQFEAIRQDFHHRRPDGRLGGAADEGRRSWRRPRWSQQETGGYRQGKLYKRVLICDKTLVSLDYLRDYGAEARPYPMAHYSFGDTSLNLVDDNSIDLDLNDLLDRRASNSIGSNTTNEASSPTPPQQPQPLSSTSTTTTSTTTTTATPDMSAAAADMSAAQRRSYQYNLLPDEDALVKCDMWDLEKGLKNRKPPADILELAVKADFDTVRDAINRCRQLTEKTLPPDDEYRDGLEIMSTEDLVSLFSMKRGLLPGTKWCGLGDQASTYNDLGPKHRIDICCRAHDHCPIRLKPFRNDYGVLNIALYTKSHCDCDADFYRCLREAHSRTADMLGNLYFNVMKLQCIREERLKVCREVRPIALGFERCVRYEENPKRRVFKFTTPPVAY